MHEVDMTRCLLQALEDWRTQHPMQPRVGTVHLLVGAFTCVEPSQLRLSFAAAVEDTWLAGARLSIVSVPLVGECRVCGNSYRPDPACGYASPCCGHPLETILSGRELKIQRIDYSQPQTCGPPVQSNPCR
ncbi:MAG: hypothetical protein TH68_07555 [Candidatus Synechococcus spongiarum 142]|uniref:Hydrogenase maturation factor HypA n=1 Tax=Candidatus Synechococcus spongiarum 142 TaxID=1608213 RepID=A0A6N3X2J8_9SYNE|nr:MAG: hypothetical protein TH68_07555 [Candidatus Synechococcus spongiarum 142]